MWTYKRFHKFTFLFLQLGCYKNGTSVFFIAAFYKCTDIYIDTLKWVWSEYEVIHFIFNIHNSYYFSSSVSLKKLFQYIYAYFNVSLFLIIRSHDITSNLICYSWSAIKQFNLLFLICNKAFFYLERAKSNLKSMNPIPSS